MGLSHALAGAADLLFLLIIVTLGRPVWQRRREPASAVFLAMLVAFSVSTLYDLGENLACSIALGLPGPATEDWCLAIGGLWPISSAALFLALAFWCHFFLVYPEPQKFLRRSPWFLALLYGVFVSLALFNLVLQLLPGPARESMSLPALIAGWAASVVAGLAIAGGFLFLLLSYRQARQGRTREGLRGILIGLSVVIGLLLGGYWIPLLAGWPVPMQELPLLEPLTLIVLLSTFVFAIVRHQVFNVRFVLSRGVAYGAAVLALFALYLGLTVFLVRLLGRPISADDPLLLILFALAVAALLHPLHRWVRSWLDRVFYREGYDYRQVVREFGQDLGRLQELPVLTQLILDRVVSTWHLRSAALVLQEEEGPYVVREVRGLPERCLEISFAVDGRVGQRLAQDGRPVDLEREREWAAHMLAEEIGSLQTLESRVIVPLRVGGRLVGWLHLGEKLSEQPFTADDLDLLGTLADQAGVALENAMLYERRRREVAAQEVLNRIALAATSLELGDLLEQVYQEVSRLVDAPNFYIAMYDEEAAWFSYAFHVADGVRQDIDQDPGWPMGDGLTSVVVRTGQPIATTDYVSECERRGIPLHGEDRERHGLSWLGVPLRTGSRVLGVLCISSPRGGTIYRAEHVRLLDTIAAQAAVVIERARLRAREQQRVAELATLNEVAQAIGSSIHLDQVLSTICRAVQRVLDTPNLYIALYNQVRKEFCFALYMEEGEVVEPPPGCWPFGEGLTSEIVRLRQPIVTDDYLEECRRRGVQPGGRPGKSWLGVPMIVGEEIVGVLVASTFEEGATYGEDDVRLLSTIAAQAAGAVQNARLYEESRRRSEELNALFQVGTKIVSTLDVQEVLDVVCQEAVRLLEATSAYATDWDDEQMAGTVIARYVSPEASPQEQSSRLGVVYREGTYRGELLRRGQPYTMRLDDPDLTPAGRRHLEQYGGKSALFLPLPVRGRVLGQIGVWESRRDRVFTEGEVLLGQNLASLAAIAVENARAYERADAALSRRVEELTALEEISRELNTTLDFGKIFDVLLERALEATGATAGEVCMCTADGTGLVLQSWRGYPRQAEDRRSRPWSVQQGILGRVVRTNQPALVADVHQDPDYVAVIDSTCSEIVVPIVKGGQPIGAIKLESDRLAAFDEEHLRFLQGLANHAAVAVSKARLFEERERRITELAILNEVGRVLSTLDLEELLGTIHEQVSRLFDTTNFYVATYEEGRDEWEVILNIEAGRRLPPERHAVGAGLTGYIIRNRVPLLFRSQAELEAFEAREGISPVGPVAKSWLGVPLVVAGKVVGVMGIQNYERAALYDQGDLALFSTIAAQVAIAISNAHLFRGVTDVRDRLQAILNSTRDGIIMMDEDGTILLVNPPIEHWTGLSREQLVGENLFRLIQQVQWSRETRQVWARELDRVRVGLSDDPQGVFHGTFEMQVEGPRIFEWSSLPVSDRHERQIGRIMVLRDATAAREAERMREDLVSMIVHDLRGPLTAVLGVLETLLQEGMDPLTQTQHTLIEVAQEGGRHILGLVNTLLDIRRLEAGRMPLSFTGVGLAELVQKSVAQLSSLAQERHLTLTTEIPPDLPLVRADAEKIGRVLENLLHNAIKYSYRGGMIRIQAWEEDGMVVCAVTDYGVGIPKGEQDRIFDKFVQVHRGGAPRGTGLGLAFCRLAVVAHGGRIWVKSEEGKGSSFHFALPIWKKGVP